MKHVSSIFGKMQKLVWRLKFPVNAKLNFPNIRPFLRRARQPEETILCARTVVSPRFLY